MRIYTQALPNQYKVGVHLYMYVGATQPVQSVGEPHVCSMFCGCLLTRHECQCYFVPLQVGVRVVILLAFVLLYVLCLSLTSPCPYPDLSRPQLVYCHPSQRLGVLHTEDFGEGGCSGASYPCLHVSLLPLASLLSQILSCQHLEWFECFIQGQ